MVEALAVITPLLAPAHAAGPALQYYGTQSAALNACIAEMAQIGTGCIPDTPSLTAWCKTWGAFSVGTNLMAFYGVVQEYLPTGPYYNCLSPKSTTSPGYAWPINGCAAGTQFVGPAGTDCMPPAVVTQATDTQKQIGSGIKESVSGAGYRTTCAGTAERDSPIGDVIPDASVSTHYGNPCDASTGNKLQIETDYAGGDGIPSFTRAYNSLDFTNSSRFGASWMHNQMRFILFGTGPTPTLTLVRGDGQRETFTSSGGGVWVGQADTRRRVTKTAQGYTAQYPNSAVETYGPDGRLLTDQDRWGRITTYTYAGGVLASIAGPYGHTITLTGRADGWSVTFPNGYSARYVLDGQQNLTAIQYQDSATGFGTVRSFKYENAALPHALTGVIDELGTRYATYTYDAAAGKATRTELAGGLRRYDFAYSANQTTVTDAAGTAQVLTFQRNLGVNNLVSRASPDGKTLTQTFDLANNLLTVTDEGGRITSYTYDNANRPLTRTDAAGTPQARTTTIAYAEPFINLPAIITVPSVHAGDTARTLVTYNAQKLPAQLTRTGFDPAGNPVARTIALTYTPDGHLATIDGPRTDVADVTTLDYWACTTGGKCGQLKSLTNALGHVTTFDTYTNGGLVTKKTDPNGLITTYTYDYRDRLLTVTETPVTGTARTTTFTYTKAGDLLTASLPGGTILTYAYTAAHVLASVTDTLGNKVSYGYDQRGNRIQEKVTDSAQTLARQIDLTYDIRNRVATINRGGSLTQTVFDALGNLTDVTDPNGHARSNGYDPLNRIIQSIDTLGGSTTLAYDTTDSPTALTSPNGAVWALTHDDLGNALTETGPDRGSVARTFDAAGNRLTQTDARGITVTRTYDALNRVIGLTYPVAGEDITYTWDTCANGKGRLCSTTEPTGTRSVTYDGFGRVATETLINSGHAFTTTYVWNANGTLASLIYPSGRGVTYTRNPLGQIAAIATAGQNMVTARAYRPDGLLKAQTYGNGLVDARTYDLQGRLTNWTTGAIDSRTHTYDANGNMLLNNSTAYSYDWLDRLISEPAQTFTYDPNGNRLSDGAGAYGYTANSNRLASAPSGAVALDAAGNTLTLGNTSFTYNQAGRVVGASVAGVPVASYGYATDGHRLTKTAAGATTVFLYDVRGNLLAENTPTGSTLREYVWDDEGRPLAQFDAGGLTYLHPDHLGTPRFGTNASKAVVWQWVGGAFGGGLPAGTATVNLRFPGQYADKETNTIYNYYRDYDPNIGRYIQSDPIGLQGGINTYGYVKGNPLRYRDPLGLLVDGFYEQSTGHLFLYDRDTGEMISGTFESGGKPWGDPIPEGTYDILARAGRDGFYRLESVDSNYGDDKDAKTGRTHFRLHHPGRTIGCIAAADEKNWNEMDKFIGSTRPDSVTVPSMSRRPWVPPTENLPRYGTIVVTH